MSRMDYTTGKKHCPSCNQELLAFEFFGKNKSTTDGLCTWCKVCRKNRRNPDSQRKYYNTKLGREAQLRSYVSSKEIESYKKAHLKAAIKYQKANRNKVSASRAVLRNVASGKIIKPDICSSCGIQSEIIHGHHWSYEKENWLDVIWLCPSCHSEVHKKIKDHRDEINELQEVSNEV